MFRSCKSKEEVKKLYRELALLIHPDRGGSNSLMALLTETYEKEMKANGGSKEAKQPHSRPSSGGRKYEEAYENIYDGSYELEIMDEIFEYAKDHQKFSTSFVDSIKEFLEGKGFITSTQYNSLIRIYYGFKMDTKEKK
jgi:curved DNA-binding protein CbpA